MKRMIAAATLGAAATLAVSGIAGAATAEENYIHALEKSYGEPMSEFEASQFVWLGKQACVFVAQGNDPDTYTAVLQGLISLGSGPSAAPSREQVAVITESAQMYLCP